jgi:hypothetical protein
MRWASGDGVSPSRARRRVARRGGAGLGVGTVMRGKGCDGSTEGLRAFPAAFIGGQGEARTGEPMHGWAKSGLVRCAMAGQGSQTVARRLRPPCHPHKGWARPGAAGCVVAGRAHARHGRAWQGLQTAARSFYGGSLLLSLEGAGLARFGMASLGRARTCLARRGEPWRGLPMAAR